MSASLRTPLRAHRTSRMMWNTAQFDWVRRYIESPDEVKDGLVYFVQGGPAIKIGFTGHVSAEARAAALQTGNPYRLRLRAALPGSREFERRLHGFYAQWRMEGEWFRASAPGLLSLIDFIGRATV